ncbi:MAG TPA: tRNA-guanine transglycosylase DpdA [Fimbriimonadaceae bacterium]|nr:tRNA-guanine transglycosylase DpdA [Fimbriimonadaceae bacterium]
MKYYFPDSQDLIDPSFDFDKESRSETRVRQRDDQYAHEVFAEPAFDGVLVSKASVDGAQGDRTRYSLAQKHRLLRVGVREFFRLDAPGRPHLVTMGDCGAFSYAKEPTPPVTVDEVIDFYLECGFDAGVSVDHIVFGYDPALDRVPLEEVPMEFRARQRITLDLAAEFYRRHRERGCKFQAVGVAQGWSPGSYASAVSELQRIGYRRIGFGGMVALQTQEILACLTHVDTIREPSVEFHLFGVTRCKEVGQFAKLGVTSFDSTSPLRQAFKDDRDNFYTMDRTYTAIRVPQIDGNVGLQKRIRAGQVDQRKAERLEQECLRALKAYDAGKGSIESAVSILREYEQLHDGRKDRSAVYRQVLEDAPWKSCSCEICRNLGVHVILFRGAERNRRRGFHNVYVFYRRLQRELTSSRQLAATIS